jgi:hypothetical protein
MSNIEKCFLLHISLGGKPSRTRIAEAAKQIKAIVEEISPDHQLAYTSGDGSAFGFLLKSTLSANQIAHRVNSPGSDDDPAQTKRMAPGSPILHDDSLLVLEIGDDVNGVGKTRVQAWFQHHRPSRATKSVAAHGESTGPSQLADQLAKIKDKLGR